MIMIEQVLNFFVSPAAAADVPGPIPAAPQGGSMSFFIIFAVFFAFMYFGVWRPQSKRSKEQRNMLNSVAKGDEVMTAGGLLGRISKINEQYIGLNIANNVDITVQKSSIVSVLPKGTLKSIE
jgi:preprotein translocase subunit YajC